MYVCHVCAVKLEIVLCSAHYDFCELLVLSWEFSPSHWNLTSNHKSFEVTDTGSTAVNVYRNKIWKEVLYSGIAFRIISWMSVQSSMIKDAKCRICDEKLKSGQLSMPHWIITQELMRKLGIKVISTEDAAVILVLDGRTEQRPAVYGAKDVWVSFKPVLKEWCRRSTEMMFQCVPNEANRNCWKLNSVQKRKNTRQMK